MFELDVKQTQLPAPSEILGDPNMVLTDGQLLEAYAKSPADVMASYLDHAEGGELSAEAGMEIARQIPEVQDIVMNKVLVPEAKAQIVKGIAEQTAAEISQTIERVPDVLREAGEGADTVTRVATAVRVSADGVRAQLNRFGEYHVDVDELRGMMDPLYSFSGELSKNTLLIKNATGEMPDSVRRIAGGLQETHDNSAWNVNKAAQAEQAVDEDPEYAVQDGRVVDGVMARGAATVEDHEMACEHERSDAQNALQVADESLGAVAESVSAVFRRANGLDESTYNLSGADFALTQEIDSLNKYLGMYDEGTGFALRQIRESVQNILSGLVHVSSHAGTIGEGSSQLKATIETAQTNLRELQESPLLQRFASY